LELSQANLQKVLDSIPEGESIVLKPTTAHVWVGADVSFKLPKAPE
jgi:hypothetical protein